MKYSIRGIVTMACTEPSWQMKCRSIWNTCNVSDPVQGGVLKNCSFIAGIASLAWKQKISVQASTVHTLSILLRQANNVTNTDPQQTDGIVPICCMQSQMHPTKIWPAFYEKAYYQWLENPRTHQTIGRPNYCKYTAWQNPVTVLNQLTGKDACHRKTV